jgi:very-short-patch-repair endonuclease
VYKRYCIDVVIPELKVAIEYDEPYWYKGREEADCKRQEEIEKGGWKFLRYKKLPNDNKLTEDLEALK